MELREAILKRRTVKVYLPKPVDKQLVMRLLNDAVFAPTHKLRQSWRFVWIGFDEKEELANRLDAIFAGVDPANAQLDYKKRIIKGAAAILVVINRKDPEDEITTMEEFAATHAMIQNFQLLAFEEGLGTCIKTRLFLGKLTDVIDLQDDEMITCAITLGYYDVLPKAGSRITAEEKITDWR